VEYVRIPQRRIGVLIGPDGETRKEFEVATGCTLEIDSRTGIVRVVQPERGDALLALQLLAVVRAIGRGFTPETARELLDPETYLEVIDIRDHTGHSRKRLERMRGRVIGRNGKTRRIIEEQSNARVVVQGHTVALIGSLEAVDAAKVALGMLLGGAEHGSVYHYLEGHRRSR
jgi:ribosomal RNA assembly protein